MTMHDDVSQVDQHIGEVGALTRALIHIAENAGGEERERLRPSAVTMLYLIADRTDAASRLLGRMGSGAARPEAPATPGRFRRWWRRAAALLRRAR